LFIRNHALKLAILNLSLEKAMSLKLNLYYKKPGYETGHFEPLLEKAMSLKLAILNLY